VLDIAKTCDFPRGLTPGGLLNFQEKVAHIVKVCMGLKGATASEEAAPQRQKPKESKARSKRDILGPQPEIIRRR
jgi:hypothetical protein